MEVRWRPRFEAQRREFSFRFTCEDCAHFDEATGECLHGFPNGLHREGRYAGDPGPATILFCKDFDLA